MDGDIVNAVWGWYIAWHRRLDCLDNDHDDQNANETHHPTHLLLRARLRRSEARLQTLLEMRRFGREKCKTSLKRRQVVKLWHLIDGILGEDPALSARVYDIDVSWYRGAASRASCPLEESAYEWPLALVETQQRRKPSSISSSLPPLSVLAMDNCTTRMEILSQMRELDALSSMSSSGPDDDDNDDDDEEEQRWKATLMRAFSDRSPHDSHKGPLVPLTSITDVDPYTGAFDGLDSEACAVLTPPSSSSSRASASSHTTPKTSWYSLSSASEDDDAAATAGNDNDMDEVAADEKESEKKKKKKTTTTTLLFDQEDIARLHAGCRRLGARLAEHGFPWISQEGRERSGLCLAGGALPCLATGLPVKDYDLFVVAATAEEGGKLVRRAVDALYRLADNEGKIAFCLTRGHVIDVRLYTVNDDDDDDSQSPSCEQFQIVLRRYADASHVVYGFDLALSGMLYTGPDSDSASDPDIVVWCTPWAMCTLATRKMLYDHSSLSSTAEKRYVKYAQRFGVDLVVPDMEQRGIDVVMRDLEAMTDVYADLSALSAVGLDDPTVPSRVLSSSRKTPREMMRPVVVRMPSGKMISTYAAGFRNAFVKRMHREHAAKRAAMAPISREILRALDLEEEGYVYNDVSEGKKKKRTRRAHNAFALLCEVLEQAAARRWEGSAEEGSAFWCDWEFLRQNDARKLPAEDYAQEANFWLREEAAEKQRIKDIGDDVAFAHTLRAFASRYAERRLRSLDPSAEHRVGTPGMKATDLRYARKTTTPGQLRRTIFTGSFNPMPHDPVPEDIAEAWAISVA